MTTRRYKNLKGLKKENLRDNMTTTEIILNMLAETSTKDISAVEKPDGFSESVKVAQRGGTIAGLARKALEEEIGQSVITDKNAAQLNEAVIEMLDSVSTVENNDLDSEKNKE